MAKRTPTQMTLQSFEVTMKPLMGAPRGGPRLQRSNYQYVSETSVEALCTHKLGVCANAQHINQHRDALHVITGREWISNP